MALSTKPQRCDLREMVEREIMDKQGRWWSATEVNEWIDDWANTIQDVYELAWATTTATITASSTVTLTDIASDILRLDAVYMGDRRMSYLSKEELERLKRDWRASGTSTAPHTVYQDSFDTISFWPPLTGTATVVFEYPKTLAFATETSTLELPAWTKYSIKSYGGWRAYSRRGPNFDGPRSGRYFAAFQRKLAGFGKTYRAYMPKRSRALRPQSRYERDLSEPAPIVHGRYL